MAVADALKAPPVTVIVTWSEFEQPVVLEVAVNVNVVVVNKFTVLVLRLVGLVTDAAGVQLYVNGPVPVTLPERVVLVPFGIDASVPALTVGNALTVILYPELTVPLPQLLTPRTVSVPEVALAAKSIVTELDEPWIVAPVPV